MIKGVIFDLNGPIMTEEADIIFEKHALHRGFQRDTIKKLMKEYYAEAHVGKFKDIAEFFEKAKPTLKITVDEMNELIEEMHATKRVNPEMIKLIESLRTKYKIALLTNFTADLERFTKDMLKIHHLFDVVVNSYDIKAKKPDPFIFNHTLKKLGLEPDEVVFIDDKDDHVEAARKLNIKSITYKDFKQFKSEFERALKQS